MMCEVTKPPWHINPGIILWDLYKAGNFKTKSFLPSAQSTKAFCCLWNFICKELQGDTAQGLIAKGDVKKRGGANQGWLAQEAPGRRRARPSFKFLKNMHILRPGNSTPKNLLYENLDVICI